jgi:hypothetical protein
MSSVPIKLSPSDLTFLWDECPRCFYLKYLHGITRPAVPFPSIFGTIDRLMKAHYASRPTSDLDPSLPPGFVSVSEQWVESIPITLPGHSMSCYLRGKYDAVIGFDDGSFGIIDLAPSPSQSTSLTAAGWHSMLLFEHPTASLISARLMLGLFVAAEASLDISLTRFIPDWLSPGWKSLPESGFLSFIDQVFHCSGFPRQPNVATAYRQPPVNMDVII